MERHVKQNIEQSATLSKRASYRQLETEQRGNPCTKITKIPYSDGSVIAN